MSICIARHISETEPMKISTYLALASVVLAPVYGLTTLQQAGMRVIYSYAGLTPPSSLITNIEAGLVGGIIFFGGNVGSNFASVVSQLITANDKSPTGLPLLLMTDQEGGEVRRLSGAPTQSAKQIGESSNPASAAKSAGTGAGQNLASYGLNVNLAPILGVYRAAGDFLDYYQRSFGNTSSLVTTCINGFIPSQQATGIAATAKHFPGLGAATHAQNTDEVPVTLSLTLNQLETIDMLPYHTAIADGVKLVMPSWAVYSEIDSLPSGLSPYWLQTQLRGNLGFKGVTISDAIEAGALEAYGTNGTRAVTAANAGIDLVLASAQDDSEGYSVTQAIASALTSGEISSSAHQAAISRITALRESFA